MPNAVFIGFTGTPLLKKDKQTSLEVFGGYIHTYKFSEAVEDEVVLDLVYEARDIDQRLGSEDKIDAWFEAKTKGLNDWQKAELKRAVGHDAESAQLQVAHGSGGERHRFRLQRQAAPVQRARERHSGGVEHLRGMQVFRRCSRRPPFKGKCAVVTSYNPQTKDVTTEEIGANTETDKQFIFNTYTELLKDVDRQAGHDEDRDLRGVGQGPVHKEPANMQLLIVVDKLLTGFDAPPCTYLYIDKSMQDHGLFQAICRTNRLDGEDKDFGYIVDYKDLFKKVEKRHRGLHLRTGSQRGGCRSRGAVAGSPDERAGAAGPGAGSARAAVRAGGTAEG